MHRSLALLALAALLAGCQAMPPPPEAPAAAPEPTPPPEAEPDAVPAPEAVPAPTVADPPRPLPEGLTQAAAVSDGRGLVLLFGGRTAEGTTGAILRYDAATGTTRVSAARLEPPRRNLAAATDDAGHVYLFGGGTDGPQGTLDAILRYDPEADALHAVDARLPKPLWGAAAVWTGERVLLFGGDDGKGGKFPGVLAFDPATLRVEEVPGATFSPARSHMAAAWDPEARQVLLFGGRSAEGFQREVFRFDPATDLLARAPATLPHSGSDAPGGGLYDAGAAYDPVTRSVLLVGGYAGGYCDVAFSDRVLRYDLRTDRLAAEARLPGPRSGAVAVHAGAGAVLGLGGHDCENVHDAVVRLS